MKTIRTIIGTLSAVLLTFALVAWFSVRRNAAFIQRTIYQGFDQTFVVALVMGCAFLLIAIILTVAIVSTDEDDEEEEEEGFQPRHQTRPPAGREEPYRRVSRSMEQSRARRDEYDDYPRSRREEYDEYPRSRREEPRPARRREEEPRSARRRPEEAPKRRERAERPDEAEPRPVKKKAPLPEREEEPETELMPEIPEEQAEPEPVEAEHETAEPEEEIVRCIFCGEEMSRTAEVCPHCGKKR